MGGEKLWSSGDAESGAVIEVALAKAGEFSMVSLREAGLPRACAASDGRGFTLGYAERA
jgi:hypothetical protein